MVAAWIHQQLCVFKFCENFVNFHKIKFIPRERHIYKKKHNVILGKKLYEKYINDIRVDMVFIMLFFWKKRTFHPKNERRRNILTDRYTGYIRFSCSIERLKIVNYSNRHLKFRPSPKTSHSFQKFELKFSLVTQLKRGCASLKILHISCFVHINVGTI